MCIFPKRCESHHRQDYEQYVKFLMNIVSRKEIVRLIFCSELSLLEFTSVAMSLLMKVISLQSFVGNGLLLFSLSHLWGTVMVVVME